MEDNVFLTLPANIDKAGRPGTASSTIDGLLQDTKMGGFSRKIEQNCQDYISSKHIEEQVKRVNGEINTKAFFNSLEPEEELQIMGESFDGEYFSDGCFREDSSIDQPDVSPHIVSNRMYMRTEPYDESFVGPPQQIGECIKMEESEATMNGYFSSQIIISDSDQSEDTGASLVDHCSVIDNQTSVGKDYVIENPGNCGVCGKFISTRGYMSTHMLTHTGELSHKCDAYGKLFRDKGNLSKHMLTHPECQPLHKYDVCEIQFTQEDHLKRHSLIHTISNVNVSKDLSPDSVCGQGLVHNDLFNQIPINSERYYSCRICRKEFGRQSALIRHLESHTMYQKVSKLRSFKKNEPLDNTFVNFRHYEEEDTGNNDKNLCSFCDHRFQSRFELNQHLLTHFKGKLQDCIACVQGFRSEEFLLKHLINHIESSMYDSCAYVIDIQMKKQSVIFDEKNGGIPENYTSKQCLSQGMAKNPRNEQPHECDVLEKGINTIRNISQVLLTHTEGPHKCDLCGKGFTQKAHFTQHMFTHTGEWPHKCGVCGKGMLNRAKLTGHMCIHTRERPYKCRVCGKRFTTRGHLADHMFTHTKERPYQCGVCQRSFIQRSHLADHMLSHTGERPHKCGLCGRGFKQKGHLKDHIYTHTGEWPYKCGVCGKGLLNRSKLTGHMFTHTEERERPHKCELCGKGFTREGQLTEHLSAHTGDWPYQCGVCGQGFTKRFQATKHMLIHTGVC